jgi:hypothetical protein
MRRFTIKVTGETPLIMHNGRLANPMDPATKEVADATREHKKNKTDENFYGLARAEFIGSLYYIEEGGVVIGPVWPSDNLHTALKKAAAKVKRGNASLKNPIAAAILWDAPNSPLGYASFGPGPAPRSLDELWKNENYRFMKSVRVGQAKVQRTRPIFKAWKFEAFGVLDTEIVDMSDLEAVAKIAGQLVGLGDWRPEKGGSYGRFSAVVADKGEYDPLAAG